MLFGALILVPLGLWRLGLDATIAFWASYVLTRPLGASVADWLGKSSSDGGVGWGVGPVTALGLLLFAGFVLYLHVTHADQDSSARAGSRQVDPPPGTTHATADGYLRPSSKRAP